MRIVYEIEVSAVLVDPRMLVLGTAQAAWDLLEKRSEIYSSRPRFVVAYATHIIVVEIHSS